VDKAAYLMAAGKQRQRKRLGTKTGTQ
jgi:hypothetical protein